VEVSERIEGLIDKITYKNQQNGYTVATVRCGTNRLTVVGILPFLSEGETAVFYGKFIIHPTYGEQFSVTSFERTAPKTVGAILRYLSSGIIKGIGPATAGRIVDRFGADSLDVISKRPEELALLKGISKDKAMRISEEYNKQYGVRDIMLMLSPYQVTPENCVAIFRKLGSNACEIIKRNPYALCCEEIGFSFEKCEKIAYDFKIPADDEMRLAAGVEYILHKNLANGHTCLPKNKLSGVAVNLLESNTEQIERVLDGLCESFRIVSKNVEGQEFIALPEYSSAEEHIAAKLFALMHNAKSLPVVSDVEIDYIENKSNIKFEDIQRNAVKQAVSSGIFVLTGGPGTGKTTTLNALIGIFEQRGLDISIAAPTGRAAKRITELCGRDAQTLHRLLEVEWTSDDKPGFNRNEQNPLDSDVIIVDEASMVDTIVFDSLLRAIRPTARLVLVGDVNQLPSVSAGNVLNDIIESGKFPFVTLKKVFRQSRQSEIINTAHAIIDGARVDYSNQSKDFFFLHKNTGYEVVETITELCTKRLPTAYNFNPTQDIQVICPSKLYETGVTNLNNVLQELLNPGEINSPKVVNRGITFRAKDKVMQVKNNYDIEWERENGEVGSGVFNGDVGYITEINIRGGFVKVKFDDRVATYYTDNMNELDLAYAITVHKSQGSEFDCVLIPMANIPGKLRYRNLLYTAVTRAKKILIVVGSEDVFEEMVQNDKKTLRYTLLVNYLNERE